MSVNEIFDEILSLFIKTGTYVILTAIIIVINLALNARFSLTPLPLFVSTVRVIAEVKGGSIESCRWSRHSMMAVSGYGCLIHFIHKAIDQNARILTTVVQRTMPSS